MKPREESVQVEMAAAVGANEEQPIDLGGITLIIQEALRPLVEKIQHLEKQLVTPEMAETTENINAGRGALQVVEMLPAQEKPTFNGGSQNPIIFLEDLKDYIIRSKRTDELMIIKESLKGSAKSWGKLYRQRWQNIKDFEKDFLANYWGDICQKNLRRKLSDAIWDPKRETTMLTHFATYWELAKTLKITDTPSGVINEIMRHYPKETQALWFSREQGDELDAAEFLRRLDNMVCPPRERTVQKRERDDYREKDKYHERRHAVRPKINILERQVVTEGHSRYREQDRRSKEKVNTVTEEATGKEICVIGNAENQIESYQQA